LFEAREEGITFGHRRSDETLIRRLTGRPGESETILREWVSPENLGPMISARLAARKSWLSRTLAAFALVSAIGCRPTPPPPPPQPDPEPEPTAAPKKKPCVAMSEECVASADTQAKIASSDFVFIPPAGWTFAQESGQTLAKAKDQPMAMAVTGVELPKSPAEQTKARDAVLPALAESIGLKLPAKGVKTWTPNWSTPVDKPKYGSAQYAIWQNTDAKYGDKPGVLLVFTTTDSAGKEILGIAVCPSDDKSTSIITKSLETFGPGSYQ
jgi:hypothetical protein